VEYCKHVSELEVTLDRYMHSSIRLRYRWTHCQKGEEECRDAVHERMEVEYNRARLQNDRQAVVWLISRLFFLCRHDGGVWCKRRGGSTSSSSNDAVDKDPCVLSKMKCCNNVTKRLDGLAATHTIWSWLSSEEAAAQCTSSKPGSYHSHRISLILLRTFAKC